MASNGTIAPISVPPSQQWDGNDGPWSSFSIHVGTPPQPARVLVSTTVGETWVVSANTTQGGCLSGDPQGCPQNRGGLVNVNNSRTWQDQGIFALGDEVNLPDYGGPYDNGDYGLETLGLGLPGGNGVTLNNMVVAALATKDFYIGNLGINQQPTNFSDFSNTHTSFLKSLKEQGHIQSLTYGYTAGNQYRLKKVFGSLTLGGYDTTKFVPTDNSFQFAGDISRDLVVGLQSVTYQDSQKQQQLLSEGILTFVDATVPHIWLPVDACKAFEQAFGITYNKTIERYLVNDTLHTQLTNTNASVSFILGNQVNGGQTVNITLPYAAFDLTLGSPIVNSNQRYFPLRQAANESQYTLGRTFLQESYLIVDYERSNFSISPALFTANAPTNLMTIPSLNQTTLPPNVTKTTKPSHSLSTGAIVGIVVAVVALLGLAAAGIFFFLRHRRRKSAERAAKLDDFDPIGKPEMDGTGTEIPGELFGSEGKYDKVADSEYEMEGSGGKENKLRAEMEGTRGGAEMEGAPIGQRVAEMEGEGSISQPVEMWAGSHGLYELDSPPALPTSSVSKDGRSSSGIRSSGGAPSPMSTASQGRHSRFASWGRRQKPVPRVPGEDSADEVSSQDDFASPRSSATGDIWASIPRRIGHRNTPQGRTPHSPLDEVISSPSETSRERHRRGADLLTRRLENTASQSTNTAGISSPISSPSPLGSARNTNTSNADQIERWNDRFRSMLSDRSLGPSPGGVSPGGISPGGISPGGRGMSSASDNETSAPSPIERELPRRPSPAAAAAGTSRGTSTTGGWDFRASSRIHSPTSHSPSGYASMTEEEMVSPTSDGEGSRDGRDRSRGPRGNFF